MSDKSDSLNSDIVIEGSKKCALSEFCVLIKDGTHGTHERVENGIPLLSAKNIGENGKLTCDESDSKIHVKDYNIIHANWVPSPDDVLLTIVGTIGHRALVPKNKTFTFQRSVAILRPDTKQLLSKYLYHCLGEDSFQHKLKGKANATAQSGVYLGGLSSIDIFVPPLPYQGKIAKILTTVDNLIEKTEALIAKYEAIKQGMMHDLFTRGVDENGRLRPSYQEAPELYKETEFGILPKSWGVFTFDDVTPDDAPICYGIVQVGEYDEKGVSVVAIYNLHSDFSTTHKSSVVLESKYIRSRIRGDDILLSVKGTIGRVDVVPTWFSGNISRDIARIRTKTDVSSEYLRQFLSSEFFKNHIDNAVVGTTRAELSIGILRKLSLFLPEKKEQDQIAKILKSFDSKLSAEKKYMVKLKNQKTALMQDLLTGKVRVPLDEETEAHV